MDDVIAAEIKRIKGENSGKNETIESLDFRLGLLSQFYVEQKVKIEELGSSFKHVEQILDRLRDLEYRQEKMSKEFQENKNTKQKTFSWQRLWGR